MKSVLKASSLLALCFQGSVAADWKLLRARDKLGQQTELGIPEYAINDYVSFRPNSTPGPYMYSWPAFDGQNSTVEDGIFKIFNVTGQGYLMPREVDSDGKGMYDFMYGQPPAIPGVKFRNFVATSKELVYDDAPEDPYCLGGMFVATFRADRDGTAYIRWFNGDPALHNNFTFETPFDGSPWYFKVELIRDSSPSCERLGCQHVAGRCADRDDCEWLT